MDAPVDAARIDAARIDAAIDAPADGPPDAPGDALADAPPDAPPDAPVDAGPVDARVDAGPVDARVDAGPVDARVDAGPVDARVDAGPVDARVDAGPVDAPIDGHASPCNLFTQTGCPLGGRCTWIIDIDPTPTTNSIGHVGCAGIGTTPHGALCVDAMATVNGGVDTCVAGDLCVARKCRSICDLTLVGGSGPGACTTNQSCVTFAGILEDAGQPIAGVCEPNCDPLTQTQLEGSGAACGSVDPTRPTGTCVSSAAFMSFHCAPTGAIVYPKTDRQPPLTDSSGTPFGNGCAPGFMPFYLEGAGSTTKLCSGMCAPVKMDKTIATAPGTPVNVKPWGDTNALGKLTADAAAVAGHAICTAGIKGSLTVDDGGIEDCRYLWFPLADGNPGNAQPSPFNDTLGFCFAYSKFLTVTVPGSPDKQPQKSCAELPVTAPADDPFGSAVENGCYPLAESGGAAGRGRLAGFRPAHGPGLAVRHVFE